MQKIREADLVRIQIQFTRPFWRFFKGVIRLFEGGNSVFLPPHSFTIAFIHPLDRNKASAEEEEEEAPENVMEAIDLLVAYLAQV